MSLTGILNRRRKLVFLANLYYFGLIVLGAIYTFLNPENQILLLEAVKSELKGEGLLGIIGKAYLEHRVFEAWVLTFTLNLFLGSIISISLPGLFLLAPLTAGVRAFLWGVLFSPTINIPAYLPTLTLPVMLLEGEAYVLALVTGVNLGFSWIKPSLVYKGVNSRVEALKRSIRETGYIYLLIILLLAISAIIEVLTVTTLT